MKEIRLTRYGKERVYILVSCYSCHKEFPKRYSFIKEGSKNFCSPKCKHEYSYILHKTDRDGFKKCRYCKEEKLLDEFYVQKTSKDGVTAKCKICICKYLKKRYPETKLRKSYKKRLRKKNRFYNLKIKYGLTEEDFNNLLEKQNSVCAICKKSETRIINGKICPLSIDHCHKTGKVRGLLCNECNNGLSRFRDDNKILNSAISYLQKFNSEE